MEVILIESMQKLGGIGDKVKVKDGYARNYLIPQNKALRATKDNVAYFEAKRAEIEKRNNEARSAAEKQAKTVEGATITLIRQASDDGRLYGSVSARDVARELKAAGHEVDRKQIALDLVIKEIGIYAVKVQLHPEVIIEVKANVARSESEAAAALKGKPVKKDEPAPTVVEQVIAEVEAEEAAEVAAEEAEAAVEEAKTEEAAEASEDEATEAKA